MGDGHRTRGETLLREALRELDPERDARRYSSLLGRLARAQWALNRGKEGVQTAERALALLPDDDRGIGRARLLSWLARTRYLRGRFREAIRDAEEALELAVTVDHPATEAEVLNTLGMAMIALGQVDEGVERMQRAIEIGRDDQRALGVDGRLREPRRDARIWPAAPRTRCGLRAKGLPRSRAGCARTTTGSRSRCRRSRSRPATGAPRGITCDLAPPWLLGRQLIFRQLRQADQALGDGDEDAAADALEAAEPLVAASSEPQWIGLFGDAARRAAAPAARS